VVDKRRIKIEDDHEKGVGVGRGISQVRVRIEVANVRAGLTSGLLNRDC
jgi:hypothetical protein